MSTSGRWSRWLDAIPLLAAGVGVSRILMAWRGRVAYPYDLEWMEGGMLAHAWRLQRGLPVYADPSADWVPYVYPPGYASIVAASGGLLDMWVGRTVSVVGILAAAAAIVAIVDRHGRSFPLGVAAASVFLMSYRASGAFMDLVRPDAVAIGLAGWAVALALDGRRGTDVAGGLLLCAAFLVKHNLAALGLPLALGLWAWRDIRSGLRFGIAAAGPALAMTAYLQWRSGGGFLTYLLAVPSSHPMMWDRGLPGSMSETTSWLGVMMVVALGGLALTARPRGGRVHRAVYVLVSLAVGAAAAKWAIDQPAVVGLAAADRSVQRGVAFFSVGAAVGAMGVAALASLVERRIDGRWWTVAGVTTATAIITVVMRAHNGGFINVLIPWHFLICALAGVWLGRLRVAWPHAATTFLGAALFTGQLVWEIEATELDPIVPTADDVTAGEGMIEALRETCDGPIFSPFAAWLPVLAGQPPSTHLIAIWDIDHKKGPLHAHMKVFEQAMAARHFACVVEGGRQPLGYGVQRHYQVADVPPVKGRALRPKTGWPVQPKLILVPRPQGTP